MLLKQQPSAVVAATPQPIEKRNDTAVDRGSPEIMNSNDNYSIPQLAERRELRPVYRDIFSREASINNRIIINRTVSPSLL